MYFDQNEVETLSYNENKGFERSDSMLPFRRLSFLKVELLKSNLRQESYYMIEK